MKKSTLALALAVALITLAVWAVTDVSNQTIRYRNGSVLKFDAQSSIKDEDDGWTLTSVQIGNVATSYTNSVWTATRYKATSTNAVVLAAPNGGSWVLTVDNDGAVNVVTNTGAL